MNKNFKFCDPDIKFIILAETSVFIGLHRLYYFYKAPLLSIVYFGIAQKERNNILKNTFPYPHVKIKC